MVARVERKGHAIHTCKKCGRTDDDHGEWFWVNPMCDECSVCFPPKKPRGSGTYSRKVTDDDWRSDHRIEPHIRQVRVMR